MAAELTLELVAHGAEQTITLPIAAHVKKYTERFIYTDRIDGTSVPIVYYESDPATSWRNLQIVDKTHLIPANTEDLVISSPGRKSHPSPLPLHTKRCLLQIG